MFTKQLEEIGLNEKEAKVYVATLELGQGSAAEIAKKSGVNRATTYFTLENLMKIGLVSASNEEKKQLFVPEDPSQLENILEKQKQIIEQKKVGLKDLIENLNSINSASVKKPIVKYYLGKEGIMRMASSNLSVNESEMYIAYSVDSLKKMLTEEDMLKLREKRIKGNTAAKVLYTYKNNTLPKNESSEVFKINENQYPFFADVAFYDDKIRLTSFEDQIGIIIENKNIATTLKSIFKLAMQSIK
jgi:sugar-specific transcriptional regulator TrmB